MKFSPAKLSALTFALTLSGAGAAVIDTTGSFSGNIWPFGTPNTATYGQTFTVSGPDTTLNSFSLYLSGNFTQDVRGYIGTWDGSKVGSILYTSGTVALTGPGTHELAFSTGGLSLSTGDNYVAFLSVSGLPTQGGAGFSMPYGTDSIAGKFVYLNNGTNFNLLTTSAWSQNHVGNNDVWFKAGFASAANQIPEPTSLSLLAIGMVALLSRRKAVRA